MNYFWNFSRFIIRKLQGFILKVTVITTVKYYYLICIETIDMMFMN